MKSFARIPLVTVSLLLATTLSAAAAHAASISGIVLYAADDFGTPNGTATFDGTIDAQLWRTALGDKWHGLAVWEGTPPDCFRTRPLNDPDFMVEIPLVQGENVFTLVGEEGPLTRTDEYIRFALNLYFDGNTSGPPGVSVLFRRHADPGGDAVSPNRSTYIYNLPLQAVEAEPASAYDDGYDRVTVTAASFVEPERFNPEWNFDFVDRQRFAPSGTKDFLGVLRVMVEPSQTQVDAGAAPRAVVPAFGGGSGSGGGSGGGGGPAYGGPGNAPNPGYGGIPAPGADPYPQQPAQPTPYRASQRQAQQEDPEDEPTVQSTTGEQTPGTGDQTPGAPATAAAGTPTPQKTKSNTTPTAAANRTTSPKPTAVSGTPTAGAPTKGPGTTATPGAAKTRTP